VVVGQKTGKVELQTIVSCKRGNALARPSQFAWTADWSVQEHLKAVLKDVPNANVASLLALSDCVKTMTEGTCNLIRAAKECNFGQHIFVLTRNAQRVNVADCVSGWKQGLVWGLCRVLRTEFSSVKCANVDVDEDFDGTFLALDGECSEYSQRKGEFFCAELHPARQRREAILFEQKSVVSKTAKFREQGGGGGCLQIACWFASYYRVCNQPPPPSRSRNFAVLETTRRFL
jgi:hypothetical protein